MAVDPVHVVVSELCSLLDSYRWLLDSYEFFTEQHWEKLPNKWRDSLEEAGLYESCRQLMLVPSSLTKAQTSSCRSFPVLPLSLLALSAAAKALSLSRQLSKQSCVNGSVDSDSQVLSLDHLFRRRIKLKKQHEISRLGEVVVNVCGRTSCDNVVDIGCGQGHLSRYLSYHHGLTLTAVEAESCHLIAATQLDSQVSNGLQKRGQMTKNVERQQFDPTIRYIEQTISPQMSPDSFLHQLGLRTSREDVSSTADVTASCSSGRCVLVGLHTCGDLAATMLRVFANSEEVAGLVSVGCCYMKLTTETLKEDSSMTVKDESVTHTQAPLINYPLSKYVGSLAGHQLSYEARELACHAMDSYIKRLEGEPDYHLKVHCFRAIAETVLRSHGLRRPQVRVGKHASKQPFESYLEAVLKSVDIPLSEVCLDSLRPLVQKWEHVVLFFILRLLLAPCVETLVLLDRYLFLQEHGCVPQIKPVFDPLMSPRNIALIATKRTK